MFNKIDINPQRQKLIVYCILIVTTLAVYLQVKQYGFVIIDDYIFTHNINVQNGITIDGFRWAFSTTISQYWQPLVWLSLMLDNNLYGLSAGDYHVTNHLLHIFNTLLLFWFFNRMTKEIWKSAFVAAFFALHPLHVESVAWISERKDVLSAFFWMLTLCFYVYYTEKPVLRRYWPILIFLICGQMSKPILVTLPIVMILFDYWPLGRFRLHNKNLIIWQLKEKTPFFIISTVISIITFYARNYVSLERFPLSFRLANAPISFVNYIEKMLWPSDLVILYPFSDKISCGYTLGASLLIILISISVILVRKRFPYLFVGWLVYIITIALVIGIIQIGNEAMADRYTYLPSIGISVILAWGMPIVLQRKKILFLTGTIVLIIFGVLTWKQCGYWRNSITLFSHALKVNKNNYLARNNLGLALFAEGRTKEAIEHYNQVINQRPDYAIVFNSRGVAYGTLGQYQLALMDYNKAISLKPDYIDAYVNRGDVYCINGQYQSAIQEFSKAILLNPNSIIAYNDRGRVYYIIGQYQSALQDFSKAILLNPGLATTYNIRGIIYSETGQYQLAVMDYSKAISLKSDYSEAYNNRSAAYFYLGQYQLSLKDADKAIQLKSDKIINAYINRGVAYLKLGDEERGCLDAQETCKLGNCIFLKYIKEKGYCH